MDLHQRQKNEQNLRRYQEKSRIQPGAIFTDEDGERVLVVTLARLAWWALGIAIALYLAGHVTWWIVRMVRAGVL